MTTDDTIEDEANEREIRRIRRRELSERLPFHCGQLMRYDEIENGDVLDRRRLTGTYYCERCCTMQPTYEDVNDDAPAAPERGDRDPRTVIVDLIGQRERLIQTLQAASSTLKSYQYGNVSPELAKEMIRTIEQVITASEQEGRRER